MIDSRHRLGYLSCMHIDQEGSGMKKNSSMKQTAIIVVAMSFLVLAVTLYAYSTMP